MDNPEILATLGTQDTGLRQTNTTQTTKKMNNTNLTKTGGKPRYFRSVISCCLLYDTRHVTDTVNMCWTQLCTNKHT